MSRAVELFVYGTGLLHWYCHVHEFNSWVFVEDRDIPRYFLVIVNFYCANTFAFLIRDERTVKFCDPDPVLIFQISVQVQPQSKKFFNLKCKTKWSPKNL